MKRLAKLLLLLFSVFLLQGEAITRTMAKISYVKGKALVVHRGKQKKAKLGMGLFQKDKVKTKKNAKIEVKFFDGSVVRLSAYSVIEIKAVKKGKKGNQISLTSPAGRVWNHVVKGKKKYTLQTPTALAGVKGTVFRSDITAEEAKFFVYQGKVEIKSWLEAVEQGKKREPEWPPKEVEGPKEVSLEEWVRIVGAMQELVVRKGELPQKAKSFDLTKDKRDPWVQWNLDRDKKMK